MDINTEIAQYLDTQGLLNFDPNGITDNTFIDLMPDFPNEAIAIYTGTPNSGDPKHGYDHPGVQFIVRGGRDPRLVKKKAQDIYDELNGFTNGTFVEGGIWVVSCFAAQSGPIRLGLDQNNRFEYSINFDLEIRNKTKYRE